MPPFPRAKLDLPPGAPERIRAHLDRCRLAIAEAAKRAGRNPATVALLAVTKYVGPDAVRVLHDLGLRDFGESTVQGIDTKIEALGDLEGLRWHLIGHLQRNKVARALQLARAIHSVDSARLVEEISAQSARRSLPVPKLFVEVNLTGEGQKTGLPEHDLADLLRRIRSDPRLSPRLGGLMAMAPHSDDPEAARPTFRRLRELRDQMRAQSLLEADGLSMGMSGDFEVAIEEGATIVRVGSTLFENLG